MLFDGSEQPNACEPIEVNFYKLGSTCWSSQSAILSDNCEPNNEIQPRTEYIIGTT